MNPSYECIRRAREESKEQLLEMRRWDVAKRLKELQLPESGSHDMLSRIARVIYPTTTGWTREACEYLRGHLVELIGGERDAQCGCADSADTCDYCHESEEVNDGVAGGSRRMRGVHGDSSYGSMGDSHAYKELNFACYDVLGNERHKAVCELQKIPDATGKFSFSSHYFHMQNIFDALGIQEPCWAKRVDMFRDRLIHLLGGDEEALMTYDVLGNQRHKAVRGLEERKPILGMTKTEILGDLGKAVTNDPNFDPSDIDHLNLMWSTLIHLFSGDQIVENAENYNLGDEPDAQNDENGDFCKLDHVTITDELRTYAEGCFPGPHNELIAIADRIDAQFARICEQQEKVLQDTIGEMQDEIERQRGVRDELQSEYDHVKRMCYENAKYAVDTDKKACMYLNLLRDAARNYKALQDKLNLVFGMWVSATNGEAQ